MFIALKPVAKPIAISISLNLYAAYTFGSWCPFLINSNFSFASLIGIFNAFDNSSASLNSTLLILLSLANFIPFLNLINDNALAIGISSPNISPTLPRKYSLELIPRHVGSSFIASSHSYIQLSHSSLDALISSCRLAKLLKNLSLSLLNSSKMTALAPSSRSFRNHSHVLGQLIAKLGISL